LTQIWIFGLKICHLATLIWSLSLQVYDLGGFLSAAGGNLGLGSAGLSVVLTLIQWSKWAALKITAAWK
jgi:hypothetical protein